MPRSGRRPGGWSGPGATEHLLRSCAPRPTSTGWNGPGGSTCSPARLEERGAEAVVRGGVAALVGWVPEPALAPLARRLLPLGAAVVPLPRPRGAEPPTLLRHSGMGAACSPLVETYATVPYDDVDPTVFAGLAYVVMFAMMFGFTLIQMRFFRREVEY